MATQDDYIKTALRLPRELHEKLQLAAKEKGRSMNAEIISRLVIDSAAELYLHRAIDHIANEIVKRRLAGDE